MTFVQFTLSPIVQHLCMRMRSSPPQVVPLPPVTPHLDRVSPPAWMQPSRANGSDPGSTESLSPFRCGTSVLDSKPNLFSSRILLVEDEGIIALDIENSLRKMGYRMIEMAASGEEAIRLAVETQPDLVLMDIRLKGGIDGVEAVQAIREHAVIPVIYLTAYADERTLSRALATNPSGYLLKPFRDSELDGAIRSALAQSD